MQSNPSRFEFGSLFLLLVINKKKLYTVKRNFTVLGWVGLVRKSILRVKLYLALLETFGFCHYRCFFIGPMMEHWNPLDESKAMLGYAETLKLL